MGYRCSGVLAVHKAIYMQAKILKQDLPALLKEMDEHTQNDVIYFTYSGFKMYDSYPEVAELFTWLETLHQIEPTDAHYDSVYAYLEVGGNGETVNDLGDTCSFELYKETCINSPVGTF